MGAGLYASAISRLIESIDNQFTNSQMFTRVTVFSLSCITSHNFPCIKINKKFLDYLDPMHLMCVVGCGLFMTGIRHTMEGS